MGLIAVSGQPGCRFEEMARIAAQRLDFELVTPARMQALIEQEFGADPLIPVKAYRDVLAFVVTRLAARHHLVLCAEAELLSNVFPSLLRVHIIAPQSVRIGNLMIDRRLERSAAKQLLIQLESAAKALRKQRFGRVALRPEQFDLWLNAASLDSEQLATMVEAASRSMGLRERGLLSPAAEAQLEFRIRMSLSRHGIAPPGQAGLRARTFGHPSEQVFANLLDFYRIAWEYEPRSFPLQWDRNGKVLKSFTPDFYLPEFDLYVELTTMKQSLVTKKNQKLRKLRELYPKINIQVFYQKDFENLIFKYGFTQRVPA